ncbi:Rossmann-like fold-containing protein [uncultured Psychrosphaera sp.]|uniref:Rossmann-like fold-containing protein n=1 Tax=uncultured Psychrosphaera sp. TaxID=1403522 RepID=UPI0030F94549
MIIKPQWSILTVGDGDLSFSRSLFSHFKPHKLTATVLDSVDELTHKYGNDNLAFLKQNDCEVITEFDVTRSESIDQLSPCYDVVIFQFPLVPNFSSQQQFIQQTQFDDIKLSVNTLNRRLLRLFLKHSFNSLLSESGAQLAYISSKDVKPYIEWDIEYSLTQGLKTQISDIHFVGSTPFDIKQFPGYKIRNVDRDKHVKDTESLTYVWTTMDNRQAALERIPSLTPPPELFGENGCDICHAGPFITETERHNHLVGKKHKRMTEYDEQWRNYLTSRRC